MSDKNTIQTAVKIRKEAEQVKRERVKNAVKTEQQIRQTQMEQQGHSR